MESELKERPGKLGGTWQQKASHLANLNGKLMKEAETLKKTIHGFSIAYNNACQMMEYYKNELDKIKAIHKNGNTN